MWYNNSKNCPYVPHPVIKFAADIAQCVQPLTLVQKVGGFDSWSGLGLGEALNATCQEPVIVKLLLLICCIDAKMKNNELSNHSLRAEAMGGFSEQNNRNTFQFKVKLNIITFMRSGQPLFGGLVKAGLALMNWQLCNFSFNFDTWKINKYPITMWIVWFYIFLISN